MRHYVVAMDENGDTIHNVYFPAEDGRRRCWTDNHGEAMDLCGMMQAAWAPGVLVGRKKLGGFEIVTEDGPAPLNDSPMFTVLEPTVPAIIPDQDTWPEVSFNEDGTWERDWDIFAIDGAAGESIFNDQVLEHAEKLGIRLVDNELYPFAIEDIADTETERTWEDFLPEALALGLRLAKLPDEMGSPYFRWYVVKP